MPGRYQVLLALLFVLASVWFLPLPAQSTTCADYAYEHFDLEPLTLEVDGVEVADWAERTASLRFMAGVGITFYPYLLSWPVSSDEIFFREVFYDENADSTDWID